MIEQILVTRAELIFIFGEQAAKALLEREDVHPARRNQYDLQVAVKAYLSTVGEFVQGADTKEEINKERTTLNEIESELNEKAAQLVSGKLFYSVDVERVLCDRMSNSRSRVLAIQNRCARSIVGKKDVKDLEVILSEPIQECVAELKPFNKENFRSRNISYLPEASNNEESHENEKDDE